MAGNDVRAIRVVIHTERESEGAPEAANELTHAALDPVAKIPVYKVRALALEVAAP